MDFIAGSFYDGFVLYAMALEETLAEGGAQNDGLSITKKTQNRQIWGEQLLVLQLLGIGSKLESLTVSICHVY